MGRPLGVGLVRGPRGGGVGRRGRVIPETEGHALDRGGQVGGHEAVAGLEAGGRQDVVAGAEGDREGPDFEAVVAAHDPGVVAVAEEAALDGDGGFQAGALDLDADVTADQERGLAAVCLGQGEGILDRDEQASHAALFLEVAGEAADATAAEHVGAPGGLVVDADLGPFLTGRARDVDPLEVVDRHGDLDPVGVGADEGGQARGGRDGRAEVHVAGLNDGVERGADDRALEVEMGLAEVMLGHAHGGFGGLPGDFGLLEGGLGGLVRRLGRADLRLAKDEFLLGLGDAFAQEFELVAGDGLVAEFDGQGAFGAGDVALPLLNGQDGLFDGEAGLLEVKLRCAAANS